MGPNCSFPLKYDGNKKNKKKLKLGHGGGLKRPIPARSQFTHGWTSEDPHLKVEGTIPVKIGLWGTSKIIIPVRINLRRHPNRSFPLKYDGNKKNKKKIKTGTRRGSEKANSSQKSIHSR